LKTIAAVLVVMAMICVLICYFDDHCCVFVAMAVAYVVIVMVVTIAVLSTIIM
jgi:hypothetical protein